MRHRVCCQPLAQFIQLVGAGALAADVTGGAESVGASRALVPGGAVQDRTEPNLLNNVAPRADHSGRRESSSVERMRAVARFRRYSRRMAPAFLGETSGFRAKSLVTWLVRTLVVGLVPNLVVDDLVRL